LVAGGTVHQCGLPEQVAGSEDAQPSLCRANSLDESNSPFVQNEGFERFVPVGEDHFACRKLPAVAVEEPLLKLRRNARFHSNTRLSRATAPQPAR
jgi:hypothetical protein